MQEGTLVIIGGVAAGTKAAAKAKRENPNWQVIVLTKDKHISYAGCGLPYYVGGVIKEEQELLVRFPEDFKIDFDIDVLINHEVTKIIPSENKVVANQLTNGQIKEFHYDRLIIATGAEPLVPPIPHIDLEQIFTLRKVTDGTAIRKLLDNKSVKRAVVVGGGLIGLEAAENLAHQGVSTEVVELAEQVLPPFDREIALQVEKKLVEKGIQVHTATRVTGFIDNGQGQVAAVATTAGNIPADLVLLSAGIRPNVAVAREAGIVIGHTGAIKVNEYGETNIPGIFAVGDCAEVRHRISDQDCWIPMGSTANKTGRVAGTNAVTGQKNPLPQVLGTAVVKIFDISAAKTGLSEKEARTLGYEPVTVLVPTADRAHYYPGHQQIVVKLMADQQTHKLLGGQVFGAGTVDKAIDVLAASIGLKAKVEDLATMDLAYAPPFSSALGPTILAANVLLNKLQGKFRGISPLQLADQISRGVKVIDVRLPEEYILYAIPGSINIPIRELTTKMADENRNQPIITVCKVGLRAFMASLKLKQMGFTNVSILDGGITGYPFELA